MKELNQFQKAIGANANLVMTGLTLNSIEIFLRTQSQISESTYIENCLAEHSIETVNIYLKSAVKALEEVTAIDPYYAMRTTLHNSIDQVSWKHESFKWALKAAKEAIERGVDRWEANQK